MVNFFLSLIPPDTGASCTLCLPGEICLLIIGAGPISFPSMKILALMSAEMVILAGITSSTFLVGRTFFCGVIRTSSTGLTFVRLGFGLGLDSGQGHGLSSGSGQGEGQGLGSGSGQGHGLGSGSGQG